MWSGVHGNGNGSPATPVHVPPSSIATIPLAAVTASVVPVPDAGVGSTRKISTVVGVTRNAPPENMTSDEFVVVFVSIFAAIFFMRTADKTARRTAPKAGSD